jgi:hypothetical protein
MGFNLSNAGRRSKVEWSFENALQDLEKTYFGIGKTLFRYEHLNPGIARSLSDFGRWFGIPCEVQCPSSAPPLKILFSYLLRQSIRCLSRFLPFHKQFQKAENPNHRIFEGVHLIHLEGDRNSFSFLSLF